MNLGMPALVAGILFLAGAGPAPPETSVAITAESARADFDALWRFVSENYAYLDSRATNWPAVPDLYGGDLAKVKSRSELIGVLERVLDELYDSHAQLNQNTAASPRLVPSGADIWAEWRAERATVVEVRQESDAERAGIRPGDEILSLDGVAIGEAARGRIGRSLRRVDDEVRSWALLSALAGRHNRERRILLRPVGGGAPVTRLLPAADQFTQRDGRLTSRILPGNVGYLRLGDSLGDTRLIQEFDSALERLESASGGLILDLRDTPGGGNTTVARAILGRFVATERPYQKHVLPSEEKETGIRRSWLELVTPRGKSPYPRRVAVLVGHWTGSMGEGLAIGFDGAQAGTVVGTSMARLLGATAHFELPRSGIGVNLPTEKLFHVNGTPREAFVPPVSLSPEDLGGVGDPWMKRALGILSGGPASY